MAEKENEDEECKPKPPSGKPSNIKAPTKIHSDERLCPVDINPCTLLKETSSKPGASKPKTCMDNSSEIDPKIRLKREHELACKICPKLSCHQTDMLNPGAKCEEEDPKKIKKKK